MDLLAPWKMCLQCLPVFSSAPPPPALPLHSSSAETKMSSAASAVAMNSSENDFQDGEKPTFSDASLTHDHQHQDLPLSDYAKEVGSLAYTPADTNPVVEGDAKHPDHDTNQSEADEEAHHHQHSHKQNDDTIDDGFHAPAHAPSMTSHVHGHTLPLEASADIELASGPHGLYKDDDTAMNVSSSADPIDGVGATRVRRRDQLKHQFKDFRNQLKQGGQHLKEEGSKHLQNMMSTMNKQSQQMEESGSFFTVPLNRTS